MVWANLTDAADNHGGPDVTRLRKRGIRSKGARVRPRWVPLGSLGSDPPAAAPRGARALSWILSRIPRVAMHVCLDVAYRGDRAWVAGVLFRRWHDAEAEAVRVASVRGVRPYVAGRFYERELPCLMAWIEDLDFRPQTILVDAHVRLDAAGRLGLGGYLYRHLGGTVPVVGVAKTPFDGLNDALPVWRGVSRRPLWVTAMGIDEASAARRVRSMHGVHRLPTLLKLADRRARAAAADARCLPL